MSKKTRLTKAEVAEKKKELVYAIIANPTSLQKALDMAGVSRSTYYSWKDNDEDLMAAIDNLEEARFRFVEDEMFKRISEGSDALIKFYMETKGKNRGYNKTKTIEKKTTVNNVLRITGPAADDWDKHAAEQQSKIPGPEDVIIDHEPDSK